MALNHNDCQQIREGLEMRVSLALEDDPILQRHLDSCRRCREYAEVQRWSHRVLRAGEIEAAPPLMSAVWASIHRASEQAWDSALSRSFRYLLPYMVAVVALILLFGGLTSTPKTTPVQAASTAYSVLNAPEVPAVAGMMATADMPSQDPAQILGDEHP